MSGKDLAGPEAWRALRALRHLPFADSLLIFLEGERFDTKPFGDPGEPWFDLRPDMGFARAFRTRPT
jgi:hypothetical protein